MKIENFGAEFSPKRIFPFAATPKWSNMGNISLPLCIKRRGKGQRPYLQLVWTDGRNQVDGMGKTPVQQSLFGGASFNTIVRDVKTAMAEVFQDSGLSPESAVERINDLAFRYGVALLKGNGSKLSTDTFYKWTNPQDTTRVPSMKAMAVFCAAFGSQRPLAVMVEMLGGQLIEGRDVQLLQWAKEYHRARESKKRMKKIEEAL
ncbi:MAG: hypothetical protein AB1568_04560 [Thermodesulfobacteriota bacterium]